MKTKIRKVPKKNYLILSVISLITIAIVSYFTFWYKQNKIEEKDQSILSGYLLEIGEEEAIDNLRNYVLDNPNVILYASYGKNEMVEEEFKNLINQNNLKSDFIYINLNNIEKGNFISELKDSFFDDDLKNKNIELTLQSNLFAFNDGEINEILYYSEQKINIKDIIRFLEKLEVLNND